MPRFDPDAMDDDNVEEDAENANNSTMEQSTDADNKTYEVTTNLKQAFSGGGGGGGFSFGFGRSNDHSAQPTRDTASNADNRLFRLDPDDVKEKPAAADFSETF